MKKILVLAVSTISLALANSVSAGQIINLETKNTNLPAIHWESRTPTDHVMVFTGNTGYSLLITTDRESCGIEVYNCDGIEGMSSGSIGVCTPVDAEEGVTIYSICPHNSAKGTVRLFKQ